MLFTWKSVCPVFFFFLKDGVFDSANFVRIILMCERERECVQTIEKMTISGRKKDAQKSDLGKGKKHTFEFL